MCSEIPVYVPQYLWYLRVPPNKFKLRSISISSVTPKGVLNPHKFVIRISSVTPTGVPYEHKPVISISTYIST